MFDFISSAFTVCGIYTLDDQPPESIPGYDQWLKNRVCDNQLQPYTLGETADGLLYGTSPSGRNGGKEKDAAMLCEPSIYNRQALLSYLNLSSYDTITDEMMFRLGFERHGNDFFKRINGSWLFANNNQQQKILTLANGCETNNSLFYWANARYLVFSSHLKTLLEFPGIPKDTNERQVASILNCLPRDFHATCFKFIKRLPPGHVLNFGKFGLHVTQYWELSDIRETYLKSDTGYTERFLELYRQSVKQRLSRNGKTGISLSGGLDSGTVAILAAEELAERNERLHAYASVPLYDTSSFLPKSRFGDERPYIDLLCKKYNNINIQYLDTQSISPVDGLLKSLEMTCQPMHAAANMFWIQNILSNAVNDTIDTLLTGQDGNMTVSFAGVQDHSRGFFDFIRNEGYFRLYHEKDILKMLVKMAVPETILNMIRKLRALSDPPVRLSEDWHHFSAINPTFAEKLDIAGIQPFSEESKRDRNPQHVMFENVFRGVGAGFGGCVEAEYGIRQADPTFDKQLLEFCFGIPDDQFYRYGMQRFLIRRTFHKMMPKKTVWNKRRGRQAVDISLRVKAEYTRIDTILKRFMESDAAREILDIQKMSGILNRTLTEKTPDIANQTGAILLRGLMVGLFLLKQEGDNVNINASGNMFGGG